MAKCSCRVRHLTPAELAEQLGDMSVGQLANWRSQGKGPAYIRSGGDGRGRPLILYPLAKVEAWEKSRLVRPG